MARGDDVQCDQIQASHRSHKSTTISHFANAKVPSRDLQIKLQDVDFECKIDPYDAFSAPSEVCLNLKVHFSSPQPASIVHRNVN